MKNRQGNVFIVALFFVAIVLILFVFIGCIFIGHTNSLLYNIKLDMYSMNKSAIISVNKGETSRYGFSYDRNSYKKCFEDLLKKNYKLDDDLKSKSGLIKEVKVVQYDVYNPGKKDKYTGKKLRDSTIHSVISVKVKPIIMEDLLENLFTFDIHEDVVLNEVIM